VEELTERAFAGRDNCRLVVSENAVRHNVQRIKAITQRNLIAVVKEDGYGTGLLAEHAFLAQQGIDFFAVSLPQDALRLRDKDAASEILVLTPVRDAEGLRRMQQENITVMLADAAQAEMIRRYAAMVKVHIALDSSFGRYGFAADNAAAIARAAAGLQVTGCYTHIAFGSDRHMKACRNKFAAAVSSLRKLGVDTGIIHIGGSAAALAAAGGQTDRVRVGSALLGRCPGGARYGLKNAVWLSAEIDSASHHKKGERAGYGGRRLRRDMALGVVRMGHRDGAMLAAAYQYTGAGQAVMYALRCLVPGEKYAVCRGQSLGIVGRVGMDSMLVSLSGDVQPGDEVRLPVNPLMVHPGVPVRWEKDSD